jgi:hypothetical protein
MTATTEILDLVRRWAAAERQNDPGLLDGVLADDFHGVGPVGFVLTREQWLARFNNGLENRTLRWRTRRCATTEVMRECASASG